MNSTTPAISVIVPVYKAEKYIHRCLDSIINQTFKDFELILVDDGSPDKSGLICDEYAIKDERIKVIHKHNRGVASARQLGLDNAKGEYTIHADPDDWMEIEMLEYMYNAIRETESDILIADYYYNTINEETYIKQDLRSICPDEIIKDILIKHTGTLWNKLIRTKVIKDNNIKFVSNIDWGEDELFIIKVLQVERLKVSYLPYAFYHYDYFMNENSITRNNSDRSLFLRNNYINGLINLIPDKYKEEKGTAIIHMLASCFFLGIFIDDYNDIYKRYAYAINNIPYSKLNTLIFKLSYINKKAAFIIYTIKKHIHIECIKLIRMIKNLTKKYKYVNSKLKEYLIIEKNFGIQQANSIVLKPFLKKNITYKHEAILFYLENKYKDIIDKYKYLNVLQDPLKKDCPIWVCWFQGETMMPPIVKSCISSIYKYTNGHPVNIITSENLSEYVSIPEYILEKVRKKQISLTHFTDIIRTNLLVKYGGIWLDATIYLTNNLSGYENHYFWSLKQVVPDDNTYVSNYKWTSYCMGGGKGNILNSFLSDFFNAYHQKETALVDYFLIDYIIALGYKNISSIKKAIDDIQPSNKDVYFIQKNLMNIYDELKFSKIRKHTSIFKLSWKQKKCFNSDSYYYKIVNQLI